MTMAPSEAAALAKQISSGELIRILALLQQTMAGFTRSASRRMDAELCILEMCQPELNLDARALNARLTRLEDQIKSGAFVPAVPRKQGAEEDDYDDRPPMPDDADAPPGEEMSYSPPAPPQSDGPIGFWTEFVAAVRKELKPPAFGFFNNSPSAPIHGVLRGNRLELHCNSTFVAQSIDKPEILETVSRKAGAMLGKPIRVFIVDVSAHPAVNPRMEQLMQFGREHSDIIKIKNK
jgi:DNA polymerase-3 subunit gamma/tau